MQQYGRLKSDGFSPPRIAYAKQWQALFRGFIDDPPQNISECLQLIDVLWSTRIVDVFHSYSSLSRCF